jgi:hypothetical protein
MSNLQEDLPINHPLNICRNLTLTSGEAKNGKNIIIEIQGRKLNVRIPPDVKNGTKIRVKGKGRNEKSEGQTGDLYLIVGIEDVPKRFKIVTHLASVFIPSVLLTFFLLNRAFPPLEYFGRFLLGTFFLSAFTFSLYFLVGGMEWKDEKLSDIRIVFFWLLSFLIGGLILYVLWYLIRVIMAKIYRIPVSPAMGYPIRTEGLWRVPIVAGAVIGGIIFIGILPEPFKGVFGIIVYIGIFIAVIKGLSLITPVSMLYYCNQCANVIYQKDLTGEEQKSIPPEISSFIDCPFCHQHMEIKMISLNNALNAGMIKDCGNCGHRLPLTARIGDKCSVCGAHFSGMNIKKI